MLPIRRNVECGGTKDGHYANGGLPWSVQLPADSWLRHKNRRNFFGSGALYLLPINIKNFKLF